VCTSSPTTQLTQTTTNAPLAPPASPTRRSSDLNYTFTATLSDASHGVTTVHTDQGDITIANGATTGTLVIASGNGEDVYNDASNIASNIVSTPATDQTPMRAGTRTTTDTPNDTT